MTAEKLQTMVTRRESHWPHGGPQGRKTRGSRRKGTGRVPAEDAKDLTTLVTPRLLRRLAEERFFSRGEAYFAAAWYGPCAPTTAASRPRSREPAAIGCIFGQRTAISVMTTGDRVYEEAIGVLEKIMAILVRSGQDAKFRQAQPDEDTGPEGLVIVPHSTRITGRA